MIRWEMEKEGDKQFVTFTVEPIHKDVKFIFTEDYFRRLGCIVHVDSGNVNLYEKTLVTQQEEEEQGFQSQMKGGGAAFSFTAGWIYKVLGPLIERVKNGYETPVDDSKKIVSVRLSESKQLAQVPVHSKQSTLNNKQPFVVETVNPTRQSIETNLYIIEQNKAVIQDTQSQPLIEKLQNINQTLEEENQRLQQYLDKQNEQQQQQQEEPEQKPEQQQQELLHPTSFLFKPESDLFAEEPSSTSLQEGVKKYVGSLHETVDEVRPTGLGSKFAQDTQLPAMRIKIEYFNCGDKGGYGLSGFMTGTQFEESMKKQKENEHMLEVSETTQGRTMQQKKKEEQDAEEQWFMKDAILNASENRMDILQKYSYLKSQDNVYKTVSETLSGITSFFNPTSFTEVDKFNLTDEVPDNQKFSNLKRAKKEAEKAKEEEIKEAEKAKEEEIKEAEKAKEEETKEGEGKEEETKEGEAKEEETKEGEAKEEETKEGEAKEEETKEGEGKEEETKEGKGRERKVGGSSLTSHKAMKEDLVEIFYIYASENSKVATLIDFRLFPDKQLITSK